MSTSALVFMVSVCALVIGAMSYCFWKLLTSERQLGGDEAVGDRAQAVDDRIRAADDRFRPGRS